jgi:branched-chain amino acid transport system permease protein
VGALLERTLLKRLYKLDPLYGLLLTFGLALIIQGVFQQYYGSRARSYSAPEQLSGRHQPRLHVPAELPRLGRRRGLAGRVLRHLVPDRAHAARRLLRAGTENPALVQAFGVNVPLMVTLTYAGFGAALAGLAGVLAAPVIQVSPLMGSNLIIVVFAVVVIGGMGSIIGSIVTGLVLGLIEGLTGVLSRGVVQRRRVRDHGHRADDPARRPVREGEVMTGSEPGTRAGKLAWLVGLALLIVAPFVGVYPIFVMTGAVLRDLRDGVQPAAGLHRPAVVRPRAFFGGAAYVTGWLVQAQHWTPELALLAGCGSRRAGRPGRRLIAIRRQGIYFAMVTLALAQMLSSSSSSAVHRRRGRHPGHPRGKLFGLISLEGDLALYFFVLAIFVGGFLLVLRIVHSPYGQVLKAIRENEPRAISLGYNVDRYKLLAFVLSASLAGLGGALKTLVLHLATLQDVRWEQSGEVILMTLLGGLGTFAGPVVGAFTVVGLQNFLSDRAGSWTGVIIGCIFVLCVVAFRKGFVGELLAWQKRRASSVRCGR